ncbi:class I SAM-dependent methyltransferase [Cohnella sp. GCM10027633]|uniref:class I SAM-dependent methyltransferase n=1 Tax=unclassified Cohnella TaxID=2636738 RepID=UPI003644EF54
MDTERAATPLSAIVEATIRNSGRRAYANGPHEAELSAISFHHYMSLCLYHPEYGYYRSGVSRIGRDGDFYTSAYVGDAMGEQLAESIATMASDSFPGDGPVDVVDWGGGTGKLGAQMLEGWRSLGEAGNRFTLTLIDGNPEHRQEASRRLAPYIAAGSARVAAELPEPLAGRATRPVIVVANELLDAFPVHRIVVKDGAVKEWGVAWDDNAGAPASCLLSDSDRDWAGWLSEHGVTLAEGQTFEVGLDAAEWVRSLADRLPRALLVLIDYGDESAELSAPHRMEGTLLCYAKHRAHDDPYADPGEQDMTAHVNFSHMRQAAEAAGWRQRWYGTQKRFLVESGIMNKLSEHNIADPFHPVARRNRAIRQLLLSDGMSELFKVQIFEKP